MAGSVVQSFYVVDDSGTSATTISNSCTGITAGNTLLAHIGWGDSTLTATCSDGTSYAVADGPRPDSTNNENGEVFILQGSSVSGGTHTVVGTISGAGAPFRRNRVAEVSGLASTSPIDKTTGQVQTAPGTGTDGISSGATAATTNANDFVMGFTQCTTALDPGTGTLNAGTGYAATGTNIIMGLESKNVSSTGTQTATFTQSVANGRITHVVALQQASAAATVAWPPPQTFHPGASVGQPPQSARFYQSPKALTPIGGNVTLSLSGQTATFTEGTPTVGVSYGLTEQTATFTEGTLTASLAASLTGQTATFSEGSISDSVGYAFTAQSVTSSEGSLAGEVDYGLTAQTITSSEGTITPSVPGNVTIQLSGLQAVFSMGQITATSAGVGAGRHKRYGVMDGDRLLIFDTKAKAEEARKAIKARSESEKRPNRRIKVADIPKPVESISVPAIEKLATEQQRLPEIRQLLTRRDYGGVSAAYEAIQLKEVADRRSREEEDLARHLVQHRRTQWTSMVNDLRTLLKDLK